MTVWVGEEITARKAGIWFHVLFVFLRFIAPNFSSGFWYLAIKLFTALAGKKNQIADFFEIYKPALYEVGYRVIWNFLNILMFQGKDFWAKKSSMYVNWKWPEKYEKGFT